MKQLKHKSVKEECRFCSGKGWTLDKWATCPKCEGNGKVWCKVEEKNEIPPTLLDDMIANWEHDNLVKNG